MGADPEGDVRAGALTKLPFKSARARRGFAVTELQPSHYRLKEGYNVPGSHEGYRLNLREREGSLTLQIGSA